MTTSRRLLIFVGLLILLAVTGGLTSFVASEGASNIVPGLATVTDRPEASVTQFAGNQGVWLFALIGLIAFNIAGAGLTGAAIFYFLNRGVERAKVEEPANHETIADALPKFRRGNADNSVGELPAETPS